MATRPANSSQYVELSEGSSYPPLTLSVTKEDVAVYLKATEDTNSLYAELGVAPPLAIAARAVAALAEITVSPAGTVHSGEEVSFQKLVSPGEKLILVARVEKKIDRTEMHLLVTSFQVLNANQDTVMTGRMSAACQAPEARWVLVVNQTNNGPGQQ